MARHTTEKMIDDLYAEDVMNAADNTPHMIGAFRGKKNIYTISLTDDYNGYTLSGPTNPVTVVDNYVGWQTIVNCAQGAFSDGMPEGLVVSLYGIGREYRMFHEDGGFTVMPFASGPWPWIDEYRKKNTKQFPKFADAMDYVRDKTWKEIEAEKS